MAYQPLSRSWTTVHTTRKSVTGECRVRKLGRTPKTPTPKQQGIREMRISKKYLLRYWWHRIRYMTPKERIYWILVVGYTIPIGAWISYLTTWWLGCLLMSLSLLQARFPLHYKKNEIGKYPFRERKYYELVPRQTKTNS